MFSSIDELGRYAYANQPRIALWNLTRLAECLLPLFSDEQGQSDRTGAIHPRRLPGKIHHGLPGRPAQEDRPVHVRATATRRWCRTCSTRWRRTQADFTNTFRRLADAAGDPAADADVRSQFTDPAAFDEWAARWRQRLAAEPQSADEGATAMRAVNPAFIPRNHRIEAVIQAAVNNDDYAPFEELLTVLAEAVRRSAGSSRPMPIRRCRISACCRHSAGREMDLRRFAPRKMTALH